MFVHIFQIFYMKILVLNIKSDHSAGSKSFDKQFMYYNRSKICVLSYLALLRYTIYNSWLAYRVVAKLICSWFEAVSEDFSWILAFVTNY